MSDEITWKTVREFLEDDVGSGEPSCSCCDNTRFVIREYEQAKALLVEAKERMRHWNGCEKRVHPDSKLWECTCGLDEFIKRIDEATNGKNDG